MSNNTDPRYRTGNFDTSSRDIVLFFLDPEDSPVAMYVGCNDEYDAFYDLEAGIVGSPLLDIVEATPDSIDYNQVIEQLTKTGVEPGAGWNEPVQVVMENMFQIDPWSGLSINMIQESAFAWFASQVYSRWYTEADERSKIAQEMGKHV
ncbi:hypothetical protein SEA_MORRILL_11 [Microbacterium phage Morrill]|nr:hypothetical protein SEA_ATRAXI_11 [Microbacterium phage Atraxi]UQT01696.1 hypothetical protein SEA_MORRILL_11 [Microbacterium phage Morrill]